MPQCYNAARSPPEETSSSYITKDAQHRENNDWNITIGASRTAMAGLTLYSRPVRKYLLTLLSFIALWDSGLVVFSTITANAIYHVEHAAAQSIQGNPGQNLSGIVLLICRCLIPMGLWINSIIELYRFWRHALTASRIILTASSSIVLLFVAIGYWAPCVPATVWAKQEDIELPFGDPSASGTLNINDNLKKYNCNIVPWLVTPGLLLYVSYLALGGVMFHYERKLE